MVEINFNAKTQKSSGAKKDTLEFFQSCQFQRLGVFASLR
jgi:hypothetical protein